MKREPLVKWIAVNALGLGLGFLANLQAGMFIRFGLDTEFHWAFIAPGQSLSDYAAVFLPHMLAGAILAMAQVLILRARLVRVAPWVLSNVVGFGLVSAIIWPLMAVDLWGRIPGPAEPIILLVGGCSMAGILQYLMLSRQGVRAGKWIALWISGLVASLIPAAILFMALEGLGIVISWPTEVFLSGFMVAGVAAWISGKVLFVALLEATPKAGTEGVV